MFLTALFADNVLHPATPVLDRPTLTTLGVQLPLSGDDNFDSVVSVRYRVAGTNAWSTGLPLFRVHPETVANYTVAPQFGGSIFDLRPATTYEIELHAVDPDGTDQTFSLLGTTRSIPGDPISPSVKNVSSSATLQSALDSATAGDVITLANGVYPGTFGLYTGGTAANPIVIRGASEDGVIIDGGNCTGCNVFEVYGAGYVHIENLTIANAERAIRFQSTGAVGNVIRRVHVKNTTLGFGGKGVQYDFYIADNILEGQLVWPQIYSDDNGNFSDQDGISVSGFGHVVAHNQISGYGDAMKTIFSGARANDFYGNEILFTYDNGIELDESEGNTRAFRNRFTNTFSPLSVQPIHGGPAYLFRNVVVNIADEPLKFHSNAGQEPSGVLVYHNTFVSQPGTDLKMETIITSHYFAIENNLFIAPASSGPIAVDWLGINDHGLFDYNGYFPDGTFRFHNPAPGGYLDAQNFSLLQGSGYETHGMVASGSLFANGLTGPYSYTLQMAPPDVTIAAGSIVQDKGLILPNINDNYTGSGPDLGALESGCPKATYGPRPQGTDESNEVVGCGAASVPVLPVLTTAVSVTPGTVTLTATGSQQFTAATTPSGGTVAWTIAPARGTISSTGIYTAPADALQGETIKVTATSLNNAVVSGSATVSLAAATTVSVTPGSVVVGQNNPRQQFTASVGGSANKQVTWHIQPATGSISSTGLYTAPRDLRSAQKITVTATSVADPTKSGIATIFLAPPVKVSPGTSTIREGGRQQFTAAVPAGGTGPWTWSLSPSKGTISTGGLYIAPGSGTPAVVVTVTAHSVNSPWLTGQTTINVVP
jgi:hypothetical protein